MTTFADMSKRYKEAIKGGLLYEEAIMSTDIELIEVNKDDLLHGLNALGAKITPRYKSANYAAKKEQRNALPGYGTPDIRQTGSFYDHIEFIIQGKRLIWQNTDVKAPDLLAKYGSLLGVFENNTLQVYRQQYLYPAIATLIKQRTGMQ